MVYPLNRKRAKEDRELGNKRKAGSKRNTGGVRAVTGESSDRKFIVIAVGVVVAVALLIAGLAFLSRQPGESVETMGNEHIASVDAEHEPYNTDPPTSGPHVGDLAPWGVSTEPVADERQIHNLEDGGVVIQYGDGVSPEQVTELASISGDYERIILAPRPSLAENEIVLTAWGRIMRLDSVDEDRIRDFINTFEGVDHHGAG